MTNAQKRALASALVTAAANLFETYDLGDGYNNDIQDLPRDEVGRQLAQWLAKLPGDEWDTRLPQPE
jgi:hypothetical protein